jgi:hypothetical protein
MVAIYVPVIQAVEPVYTQVTQTRNFDHKTAFIFRALHACNEAKDHRVTCLGTAVSYNRRCRNPLYKLTIVLTVNEMIEAAENGTFYFQDLNSTLQSGLMACLAICMTDRRVLPWWRWVRLRSIVGPFLPTWLCLAFSAWD